MHAGFEALQMMALLLPGLIATIIINALYYFTGKTDLDKVLERLAVSFLKTHDIRLNRCT